MDQRKVKKLPATRYIDYIESNTFVYSKYRMTLFANQIHSICLSKIDTAKPDKEGSLCLDITAAEIKEPLGITSGRFYERLSKTVMELKGIEFGITDPEDEYFLFISPIEKAEYKNGVLHLRYARECTKYLINLHRDFTKYNLGISLSFKCGYAYRLYKIIKSKMYVAKGDEYTNSYAMTFGLAELKFMLGVYDIAAEDIRSIVLSSKHPDFEKAESKNADGKYLDHNNFRRRVIDKAVKEINEKSDINLSYKESGKGLGGKLSSITFFAAYKISKGTDSEDMHGQGNELIELICKELQVEQDAARNILDKAENNEDKVKDAINFYKGYKKRHKVDNVAGFILWAIKTQPKNVKSKNKFCDYKQNEYDFDELEKFLASCN